MINFLLILVAIFVGIPILLVLVYWAFHFGLLLFCGVVYLFGYRGNAPKPVKKEKTKKQKQDQAKSWLILLVSAVVFIGAVAIIGWSYAVVSFMVLFLGYCLTINKEPNKKRGVK